MGQFARYVDPAPKYQSVNRMVDYAELHKVLMASDGRHFDAHFENMLVDHADDAWGRAPQLLARIERDAGRKILYAESEVRVFPHTFEVLKEMAHRLECSEFVGALLGPSGMQVPLAPRYGIDVSQLNRKALRADFEVNLALQFKDFVEPALLEEICGQVGRSRFKALFHDPLGIDYSMDFGPTHAILHYLITDSRLIALFEFIAGIKANTLCRFSGRIYQMIPFRDRDSYHGDIQVVDRRLLAISMSLSPKPCVGGYLHLRRKEWWLPFFRSTRAVLGETVVFKISRRLEHKAGRVYRGSRTNFAGWLCAGADFDYDGWVDAACFGEDETQAHSGLTRRLFCRR